MASKKLNERKKARRVAEKKQQALKRQEQTVLERRQRNVEYRVQQMMKAPQAPIRNVGSPDDPTFTKNLTKEQIIARLNHNLEILKALEEEYDKEMAARQERNSDLEESGYSSLKEKMDALHGQVVAQQKSDLSFGGEAEVVFTPSEEISQED